MPFEITVHQRHFYSTACKNMQKDCDMEDRNMLDAHNIVDCYIFQMCLLYIPFSVLKYSEGMKSCSHIEHVKGDVALRACSAHLGF